MTDSETGAAATDDRSLTILKLGGSVVTDKDERETIDMETIPEVARAIGAATKQGTGERTPPEGRERLIVVHGGGSFGHHHAAEHGVSRTEGTRDVEAIRQIHDAMGRLNKAVLDFLGEAGVDAVPVRPFSAGHRDDHGTLVLHTDQVAGMLDEGFVPVLHGDVITHAGTGATIVSGDELVTELASQLSATRVGLCSTVPGVLDDDDTVIDEIRSLDDVRDYIGESESTDVTGGMAAKVDALLGLAAPASIFGPEELQAFLAGDSVGTLVHRRPDE